MINATNGWALGSDYVLRTTDGGVTWYNMIMPSLPSIRNAYFRDSNKGWVLTNDSIYRTADGGTNWTRYDAPFNGGRIQFLDDNNGFVLSGEGIGMQKQPVYLYQTTNGGATWTLKFAHDPNKPDNGLPVSGHKNGMSFRNMSTGWVGGEVPTDGVYIFKTTNGGTTWARQPLTLPAETDQRPSTPHRSSSVRTMPSCRYGCMETPAQAYSCMSPAMAVRPGASRRRLHLRTARTSISSPLMMASFGMEQLARST
jgi:hypothetical protein